MVIPSVPGPSLASLWSQTYPGPEVREGMKGQSGRASWKRRFSSLSSQSSQYLEQCAASAAPICSTIQGTFIKPSWASDIGDMALTERDKNTVLKGNGEIEWVWEGQNCKRETQDVARLSQSLIYGSESRACAKRMRPPVPGVSQNQLIEDIPGSWA